MRIVIATLLSLVGVSSAAADTVIATQNIRSKSIITANDIKLVAADLKNGFSSLDDVIGQEARVILYAGRPVTRNDIGPPALVERNQIVTLAYTAGPITILAEGRSLGRAGAGEILRVMNLSSRTSIAGTVRPDGTVAVTNSSF